MAFLVSLTAVELDCGLNAVIPWDHKVYDYRNNFELGPVHGFRVPVSGLYS